MIENTSKNPTIDVPTFVDWTLRDFFAAFALAGYVVEATVSDPARFAQMAYKLADAMLVERSKTEK
jgi:hypothetical protein